MTTEILAIIAQLNQPQWSPLTNSGVTTAAATVNAIIGAGLQ